MSEYCQAFPIMFFILLMRLVGLCMKIVCHQSSRKILFTKQRTASVKRAHIMLEVATTHFVWGTAMIYSV